MFSARSAAEAVAPRPPGIYSATTKKKRKKKLNKIYQASVTLSPHHLPLLPLSPRHKEGYLRVEEPNVISILPSR